MVSSHVRPSLCGPHRWLGLALLLVGAVAAPGCSAPSPAPQGSSSTVDVAGGSDAAPDVAAEEVENRLPAASCAGSALNPAYAEKDSECAFLATCPSAGDCYCGKACPASKQQCSTDICKDVPQTCWCGESCAADKTKKACPEYICAKLGDIPGCEPQDDCVFMNKDKPAWCGCLKMPDRAPDCWCGPCNPPKPACSPDKCVGKKPDKCIVVPGEPHKNCYCEKCGLLGDEPKCFFIVCP